MLAAARYYADLVIANLMDHAYAALTVPEELMGYPELFAGLQRVPTPMLEENWDFDSECLTGELLHRAVVPQRSQVSSCMPFAGPCKGDSMLLGHSSVKLPLKGDAMCAYAWQHWEFVDEGKPGHPKLGFRTLLPDTSVVVQARQPPSACGKATTEPCMSIATNSMPPYARKPVCF